MTTKYRANHVYWDAKKQVVLNIHDIEIYRCNGKLKLPTSYYRFDSQHEFRVYLELCRMYGEENVERQYPVKVLPPSKCYPKGLTWKVDFTVYFKKKDLSFFHNIEAKGIFLPEFGKTLAMLEQHNSMNFHRTKIVFPNKIPTENKVVKALSKTDFALNLLTLKELKQLTELS